MSKAIPRHGRGLADRGEAAPLFCREAALTDFCGQRPHFLQKRFQALIIPRHGAGRGNPHSVWGPTVPRLEGGFLRLRPEAALPRPVGGPRCPMVLERQSLRPLRGHLPLHKGGFTGAPRPRRMRKACALQSPGLRGIINCQEKPEFLWDGRCVLWKKIRISGSLRKRSGWRR